MTSEGEWSPWPNRSKPRPLLNRFCMKKALPRNGIVWEKTEALPGVSVSWTLRNSSKHITLPAMCKQSFHLPSEVSGHPAVWREICFPPKFTPALNSRLCAQPQRSWPWRKHWAPKSFQAVNSWILLMRASSDFWEQMAAAPCSCLHGQPPHEASVLLHHILYKTQTARSHEQLGRARASLSDILLALHKCSFLT